MNLGLQFERPSEKLAAPIHLIIHGDQDTSVHLEEASEATCVASKESYLAVLEGANHVFGSQSSLGILTNYLRIYSRSSPKLSRFINNLGLVLKKKCIYLIFFLERTNKFL